MKETLYPIRKVVFDKQKGVVARLYNIRDINKDLQEITKPTRKITKKSLYEKLATAKKAFNDFNLWTHILKRTFYDLENYTPYDLFIMLNRNIVTFFITEDKEIIKNSNGLFKYAIKDKEIKEKKKEKNNILEIEYEIEFKDKTKELANNISYLINFLTPKSNKLTSFIDIHLTYSSKMDRHNIIKNLKFAPNLIYKDKKYWSELIPKLIIDSENLISNNKKDKVDNVALLYNYLLLKSIDPEKFETLYTMFNNEDVKNYFSLNLEHLNESKRMLYYIFNDASDISISPLAKIVALSCRKDILPFDIIKMLNDEYFKNDSIIEKLLTSLISDILYDNIIFEWLLLQSVVGLLYNQYFIPYDIMWKVIGYDFMTYTVRKIMQEYSFFIKEKFENYISKYNINKKELKVIKVINNNTNVHNLPVFEKVNPIELLLLDTDENRILIDVMRVKKKKNISFIPLRIKCDELVFTDKINNNLIFVIDLISHII